MRTGKGTLSHLLYDDALVPGVRAPLQQIDDILAELQQGHGTAGKFLKDPALYDDLREDHRADQHAAERSAGRQGHARASC